MNELLSEIKEVQEVGKKLANWYLDHGYILLDVQAGTRVGSFPANDRDGHQYQYYVGRNPIYVLGRPDGVEPAPLMPSGANQVEANSK